MFNVSATINDEVLHTVVKGDLRGINTLLTSIPFIHRCCTKNEKNEGIRPLNCERPLSSRFLIGNEMHCSNDKTVMKRHAF